MVATVNDVVKTLLGDYELKADEITPDEWIAIFKGFLKQIDLNRLKFANVRALHGTNVGLPRDMPTTLFRNVAEKTGLYMRVADIDSPPFNIRDFPLRTPQSHHHDRLSVKQRTLLMTRKSEFVLMHAQWVFEVDYDNFDRPTREYQKMTNLTLATVSEKDAVFLVKQFPGLPSKMMQALIMGLADVVPDMESDLRRHQRARDQLERVARVTWQLPD